MYKLRHWERRAILGGTAYKRSTTQVADLLISLYILSSAAKQTSMSNTAIILVSCSWALRLVLNYYINI